MQRICTVKLRELLVFGYIRRGLSLSNITQLFPFEIKHVCCQYIEVMIEEFDKSPKLKKVLKNKIMEI